MIDLGFNMPNPSPTAKGELIFSVTDRVVVSYLNAKRLNESLSMLVKRYEEQFGVLAPPKTEHKK